MLYIWPNGDWCWASDQESCFAKSDDFLSVSVPEWCDDDDADRLAAIVERNGSLNGIDLAGWFGL